MTRKRPVLLGVLLFCSLLSLGACGGAYTPTKGSPLGPPITSSPLVPNFGGNWSFNATSTASTVPPPMTIEGSITQSSSSLNGTFHVEGSNCFDRMTTVNLTGTLSAYNSASGNVSLTSASVAGQVISLTGTLKVDGRWILNGTYTISGGCANGDEGALTGAKIASVDGHLDGTFTPTGQPAFNVSADLSQVQPSSEGSFGVDGTVVFEGPCWSSGTITSGTFPNGSFLLGTSVVLEIATTNGTISFAGKWDPSNSRITGDYTAKDGTCDGTGTAILKSNPWDY